MKIASTKERILQFIDYKCISKTLFFEKTGIKRGFLDSDKLNQAVSDDHITKIIANYPEVSIEWLLTGNGHMLRSNTKEAEKTIYNNTNCNSLKDKNISTLISILNDTLKEKDKQIDRLLSIIEKTSKSK